MRTRINKKLGCRRVFENLSEQAIRLRELGLDMNGITFGEKPIDDYFYHNEKGALRT